MPCVTFGKLQPLQYSALDLMGTGLCLTGGNHWDVCQQQLQVLCIEVVFETGGAVMLDDCGKGILHRRGTVSEKQGDALHMCICVSTCQY